jgi:omega-amidase
MKTHLIQFSPEWENKAANYEKVRALITAANPAAGGLIVLPETFATGFSMNTKITAEPERGPTEQFLREMAAQHDCCVLGGLVTETGDGRGMNQSVAVAPRGDVLVRYTKNRPFSLIGEDVCHRAGEGVALFEWCGLKIAPLICYDLRFPELGRAAVRAGAEVLVYTAAWPVKRAQHWLTLLQARGIENMAAVIGVNRCGSDPEFHYSGRSVVVDAHGVITADAGEQEHVLTAEITPSVIREWRAQFPALRDAGM